MLYIRKHKEFCMNKYIIATFLIVTVHNIKVYSTAFDITTDSSDSLATQTKDLSKSLAAVQANKSPVITEAAGNATDQTEKSANIANVITQQVRTSLNTSSGSIASTIPTAPSIINPTPSSGSNNSDAGSTSSTIIQTSTQPAPQTQPTKTTTIKTKTTKTTAAKKKIKKTKTAIVKSKKQITEKKQVTKTTKK